MLETLRRVCSIAALIGTIAGSASGQTITVTNTGDSGPGSLRQAIADITSGGAIVFDPSLNWDTITLTSGELLIDKDLTITGPGADRMTIEGNNASRVFHVDGAAVQISDVTITGGRTPDRVSSPHSALVQSGGGIFSEDEADLTLVQVVVTGNRTGDGADGDDFFGPRPGGLGGGIASMGGKLTVIDSIIEFNTTGDGGDCTEEVCSGVAFGGDGGGIWAGDYCATAGWCTTTIVRSTIANNTTGDGGYEGRGGEGGGIRLSTLGSPVIVESSTVSGNTTGWNSSLSEQGKGGGISSGGQVHLFNSTVTRNDGYSGGIIQTFVDPTRSITAKNSIIAGNTHAGDPAAATADCTSDGYVSNGFNLVGEGTGCPATGPNDMTVLPADVFTTVLGGLGNSGGPTPTHRLKIDSPAIDQGSCPGVHSDQRGYGGSPTGPRVKDVAAPNADDGCDIGAFEFSARPLHLIVYFKRPVGWRYPHIHYYDPVPDIGATTWPGEPLVHEGCGWYRFRFPGAGRANMVFNGHTSPQTADLFRVSEGWFDGTTNVWSETNPDPPCTDIVRVGARAFLQGAYLDSELMSRTLQLADALPLAQPYADSVFTETPLKHNGDESNADLGSAGITHVTDWSITELRTGTSADTKIAARAAIHDEDGYLIDPETLSYLEFPGVAAGSYHVVVRHRNHLPVMSKTAVSLGSTGSVYDFTDDPLKAFGTNPMTQMTDGSWAMWAGDANLDGNVQALDFNAYIVATVAGASGYELADSNMDTNVQALDFNLYIANTLAGASSQVPE